jgi:hypothetical protein
MGELKRLNRSEEFGLFSFLLLVWLLALLLSLPVRAENANALQTPVDGAKAGEQAHARWNQLPETLKDRIRQNYQRWELMPPEKQQELKTKFQKFLSLSAQKRAQIIDRYRHFIGLPSEEQEAIRKRYAEFMSLPEAVRRERLEKLEDSRQTPAGETADKDSSPLEKLQKNRRLNRQHPLRDKD